jgi:hypothetical protein
MRSRGLERRGTGHGEPRMGDVEYWYMEMVETSPERPCLQPHEVQNNASDQQERLVGLGTLTANACGILVS